MPYCCFLLISIMASLNSSFNCESRSKISGDLFASIKGFAKFSRSKYFCTSPPRPHSCKNLQDLIAATACASIQAFNGPPINSSYFIEFKPLIKISLFASVVFVNYPRLKSWACLRSKTVSVSAVDGAVPVKAINVPSIGTRVETGCLVF